RHRHQGAVAVTEHRGYISALRWFRAKPADVEHPPTESTGTNDTARARLAEDQVAQARALAARSETVEEARAAYREAVALAEFDATVVLEYARFLIKNSRGTSAEEVLALSLARNGAQVDALELYLELVRELDLRPSRAAWALERLQADIDLAPAEHRGALDFAIPHHLESALETIGSGPDPVNRAIVQIHAAYEGGAVSEGAIAAAGGGLGANDVLRAHLTAVLAAGNRAEPRRQRWRSRLGGRHRRRRRGTWRERRPPCAPNCCAGAGKSESRHRAAEGGRPARRPHERAAARYSTRSLSRQGQAG